MTTPNNDPTNRPPSLYQMTAQRERKGNGGLIALVLLVLLLVAGGAYYFLQTKQQKPAAVADLPAAATPAPRAPATPPQPTPYNSITEQKYIDDADHAFMAVQQPKLQAFNDAFAALKAAGYASPKGLASKEAVAARRELIAKCIATNDDYATFVTTQEATYKDALSKTPLTPGDAKKTYDGWLADKAKTADRVKLRQAEHDFLQSCDDMMAALEKWNGNWSLTPAGKLNLKRKENIGEYNELAQKCTARATLVAKLTSEFNGVTNADGTAPGAASESAAPGAPSAAVSPAAAASPKTVP